MTIKLLKEYITLLLEEENDYRGEHTAPGKEGGSPLWNLSLNGTYPEDIYSVNGAKYYGDHGGDYRDYSIVSLIQSFHNKPKRKIKIYRAVPAKKTPEQEIVELQKQKTYILKHGKVPPNVDTHLNKSAYYDHVSDVIERIEKYQLNVPGEKQKALVIQPGDWVTIERRYAVEHGKASLNGEYKILSKVVSASELYTDGNSLYEWGWNP
jgi:hypothetical protein